MSNYSISGIRKEVIKKIINDKYKNKYSISTINSMINEAYSKYNSDNVLTQPRLQYDVTNSSEVTETNKELYLDICTLFETINIYYQLITNTQDNNLNILQQVYNTLNKANSTLNEYEITMKGYSNPIYKIENFIDRSNIENNLQFYKERYNEQCGQLTANVYNKEDNTIILPKLRSANMAYLDGVISAKAYKDKQFCQVYAKKTLYPVDNVIIPDNTFWEEQIETDTPIEIEDSNDNYSINTGALCELVIDFESVTVINELLLIPYKFYPIDILNIKYRTTDAEDEEYKNLVYKDNQDETLKPQTLTSNVSYKFKNILVKKLVITLNQLNYEREIVPIQSQNNIEEFVNKSIEYESDNENKLFEPNIKDFYKSDSQALLFDDMTDKNIKLSDVFKNDSNIKRAIKYIYKYGLTSVIPNNNEFDKTGIYVSKEMITSNDIKNIKIITDELHPKVYDNCITDIEYYITFADQPTWTDWQNILPLNKNRINCERLQEYDDLCYLRFNATKINGVYADGTPLNSDDDYYVKINNRKEIYAIEIPTFDPMTIYTIDYQPIEESHIIQTPENQTITTTEELKGNNSTCFVLLNNVSLATADSAIYLKIIDNESGKIIGSSDATIKNLTNNINSYNSYTNFNTEKNTDYQFYVDKNYLYFNRPISKDYKIIITYQHNINKYRLKAILRRNSKLDKYITPVLKSIKYEITTE